jgi:hypothetical protein
MGTPVKSRKRLAIVAAAAAASLLAGCSGGSSDGDTPNPSGSATTGAQQSPAVASKTFHNITAKQAKRLGIALPLLRGVDFNTYYPDTKILEVKFKPTATKLDEQNVEELVRQAREGKPLPKPTPTPTPKTSTGASKPPKPQPTPTITYHNQHKPCPPPSPNKHGKKGKKPTHRTDPCRHPSA